jgi:hypothetical protein
MLEKRLIDELFDRKGCIFGSNLFPGGTPSARIVGESHVGRGL